VAGTLVDSNVVLDIFTQDEDWLDWSAAMLDKVADEGPLFINQIIYAEVSAHFDSVEALDDALPVRYWRRIDLPWAAAFLAGRAYVQYRRKGGMRTSLMPGFYIGAHAAIAGLTLLTRDGLRYRHYFPTLRVLAP
jgi:predicted nucleic acid-binding protein